MITFFFKLLYDVFDIARSINFFDALWQCIQIFFVLLYEIIRGTIVTFGKILVKLFNPSEIVKMINEP